MSSPENLKSMLHLLSQEQSCPLTLLGNWEEATKYLGSLQVPQMGTTVIRGALERILGAWHGIKHSGRRSLPRLMAGPHNLTRKRLGSQMFATPRIGCQATGQCAMCDRVEFPLRRCWLHLMDRCRKGPLRKVKKERELDLGAVDLFASRG